ncbi:MAG: IclR family transcriptional regulator [Pararhodobacter sp.]
MNDETHLIRPVGALVHALRILRHLAARGQPEGVSAIARATGVNGSTCFNILRTLAAEGLVSFDAAEKTYRPGIGLVELAVGVLGANPADLIHPELERLARKHGTMMSLWQVTDADRIVLIDRAFDPEATRVEIPQGKRLPALIGGIGRMIAAHRDLPEDALRRAFDTLRWQSPPSFDAYLAGIREARRLGYAIDNGQVYTGVDVVGALVCDAAGTPRYGISSISLIGQTTPETQHVIGRDLRDSCLRLGRALFAAPARTAQPEHQN